LAPEIHGLPPRRSHSSGIASQGADDPAVLAVDGGALVAAPSATVGSGVETASMPTVAVEAAIPVAVPCVRRDGVRVGARVEVGGLVAVAGRVAVAARVAVAGFVAVAVRVAVGGGVLVGVFVGVADGAGPRLSKVSP